IPRYKTAFLDPFSEIPTLNILCAYYDSNGNPVESAPEQVLKKAHEAFQKTTGYTFEAMGELEYYIISEDDGLFKAEDQKAYHESSPFSKWGTFRAEAMKLIAESGGNIKYGHSEVGNFTRNGLVYEQNEIEFLPVNVEDAADQLVIAKWIIRTLAAKRGVTVTFSPKITVGKAGSGLHIHSRVMKEGKNMMIEKGKLSKTAKTVIAGYMEMAPSLTAFGNMNPTSYFRLVPHQEAPTNICWGDRNRSVLVRVPLGWTNPMNMIHKANPLENSQKTDFSNKQTIEIRNADGSADVYLLLAGITVAARYGFELKNPLQIAENTYVDIDIFKEEKKAEQKKLGQLPSSCVASAKMLEKQKEVYMQYHVFPESLLNYIISYLKAFHDENLRSQIENDEAEVMKLVAQYFHCG
ncbi:MAG TPA: glutamine synthetase, partial [Bacteroidetes bacterium]|nr:glutamine synthetase [Bacteroidota bacterium]